MSNLHEAIESNDFVRVQSFLGASQDPKGIVNDVGTFGISPLEIASEVVDLDLRILDLLLENGADVYELRDDCFNDITLLSYFVKNRSLDEIKLFHTHEADFFSRDSEGNNLLMNCVEAQASGREEVIDYLIQIGLDVSARNPQQETAVMLAYSSDNFSYVKMLLDHGASEEDLKWDSVIRAASIGSRGDLKTALTIEYDRKTQDPHGRTALSCAAIRGCPELVSFLLESGFSFEHTDQHGYTVFCNAIDSRNPETVKLLIHAGCSPNSEAFRNCSGLNRAIRNNDAAMVRTLLELGAIPNVGEPGRDDISGAQDREVILVLDEYGCSLDSLTSEGRTSFLDLGDDSDLRKVSKEEYLKFKHPRWGRSNPERLTNPFWTSMVKIGAGAGQARYRFSDPWKLVEDEKGRMVRDTVWCFERFGQTMTRLQDGRIILIGGEYEDSYHYDFCIFNDVTVIRPDKSIDIFGYPAEKFMPTDFHSAHLVGEYICIIGGLGYQAWRPNPVTDHRLSVKDYSIEPLVTFGDIPLGINRHQGQTIDNRYILIRDGEMCVRKEEGLDHFDNLFIYELDLTTNVWTKSENPCPNVRVRQSRGCGVSHE